MRCEVGLENRESCESPVEVELVDGLDVRELVVEETSQDEKGEDELQGREGRVVRHLASLNLVNEGDEGEAHLRLGEGDVVEYLRFALDIRKKQPRIG